MEQVVHPIINKSIRQEVRDVVKEANDAGSSGTEETSKTEDINKTE